MSKTMYAGDIGIIEPESNQNAVLFENMPIDTYHADKSAIGKSMLCDMEVPAIYDWKHNQGGKLEEKDYFNIGNAVHTLALEPDLFGDRFYTLPETYVDIKTGEEKKVIRNPAHNAYKKFLAEAGQRKIITADAHENIKGMAAALIKSPIALSLLKASGKVEASIFWTDPQTGLRLKTRPDFLRDDRLCIDLKTTNDASPKNFDRAAFDYHYDISVAMTNEGYRALTGKPLDNYVFLLMESKPPYLIAARDAFRPCDPQDLSKFSYHDAGAYRFRKYLDKLVECKKTGKWPAYSEKIEPMTVPYYAMKKMEKESE